MKPVQAVSTALACGVLSVMAVAAHAAEKTRPYPHYWMSVATSNQSIPGMSSEMPGLAGLFGGKSGFGPRRELHLQLESPQPASGVPQASHGIPPALNMGAALPLVTPQPEQKEYAGERGTQEKYEKPKARLLIYWGCGETIGKGQPRVIDTARMSPADFGKSFAGRTPTRQTPPAPHKGWVYGEWPNPEDRTEVSKDGSLVGSHLVSGNYLPDIPFSLDKKRDFMAPVEFAPIQATTTGAMKVEWQAIPTAIGYFASAMGSDQNSGDSIFWTSSELPEIGFGLQDYLTPADVSRFIKEKVVMEPSRTTCTVPPVFKEQGAMLQFIAYGEELNLAQPPRPKDPKKPWNPIWSVKVRLKSTGMTTLMASDDGSGSKRKPTSKRKQPVTDEEGTSKAVDEGSDSGSTKSKGGVGDRIRGIFGF